MGVRSPFTPTLSPLEKGGEGVGSGGDGKRDILSAPAPRSRCTEGWYHLKRKSMPGNSIIPFPIINFPFGRRPAPSAPALWGGGAQNVPLTIRWSYTISHHRLSFWALATAVRARPSPLHIKKALASKWYKNKPREPLSLPPSHH